ncbi:MAG: DoxX family protein [Burkholderiales bacterium]|nr:DoxX family protein [Burkholderiales bacterium]
MNFIKVLYAPVVFTDRVMDWISPWFLLGLRVYVANVFFKSGLTKIQDFSSTVALFESEYKVPFISPTLAALSGTAAELILPALLVLGLASRPVALVLFVFNIVAVISYSDISESGVKDHMLWGTMILVVAFFGPGRFSIDEWLKSRFAAR